MHCEKKNRNTLEAYSEALSNIQDGVFYENSQRISTVKIYRVQLKNKSKYI